MLALVIDDSTSMRAILHRIVADLGFDCLEAANGQEALYHLRDGRVPDLCLVDWYMPVMDGLAFVTAVRSTREWRQVPLVMVTTEGDVTRIMRGLAAGAHEYVIKPFTPDAIHDKLQLLGLVDTK